MQERYRNHLILAATYQRRSKSDWGASAHIEFTENFAVQNFVLKPAMFFKTEKQAERFIIDRAKEWIDNRLTL